MFIVTGVVGIMLVASPTLQERIDAVEVGGTLALESGTYEGPITITRDIRILGAGADATTITIHERRKSIVTIDIRRTGRVAVENLRIQGLGLEKHLKNPSMSPQFGGGVLIRGGSVHLQGVHIVDVNASGAGGGVYLEKGELLMEDGIVARCRGHSSGGVNAGRNTKLIVRRTDFVDNAYRALSVGASYVELEDVSFRGNIADLGTKNPASDLVVWSSGSLVVRRVKFEGTVFIEDASPIRTVVIDKTYWPGQKSRGWIDSDK